MAALSTDRTVGFVSETEIVLADIPLTFS